MSKYIATARKTYLATGKRTEARTWRVVRNDGEIFTFSSSVVDLVKGGETYSAALGFNYSAVANSGSLAVDTLEVTGFLADASINEEDINAGMWDNATIFVADVNYNNVAQGQTIVAVGNIGNISAGKLGFTVEQRSLSQKLAQNIGRIVTPTCDANVFDARCGLNSASYLVTGTVTGTSDNKNFTDTSRSEDSGYFDFGLVTFTSGANVGLSQEIKRQTTTSFALQLRMPRTIAINDTYSMLPGCNKILKGPGQSLVDTSNDEWAPNAALYASNANYAAAWDAFWAAHLAAFAETPRTSAGSNLNQARQDIQNFWLGLEPGVVGGDCKSKYNNVVNFRGFPYLPGLARTVGNGNAST